MKSIHRRAGRSRPSLGTHGYPFCEEAWWQATLRAQRLAQVARRALGWIDVHLDAGAELEPGADGEPGDDVDVPAELLRAARGRADPEVQLRRCVEDASERGNRLADHRRPNLAVGFERGRGLAGHDPQLKGR